MTLKQPHTPKGQSQMGEEEKEGGVGGTGFPCRLNAYSYLRETKTPLTDIESRKLRQSRFALSPDR